MTSKVHRVKDLQLTRYFRKIPYKELTDVLKADGVAFLENGDLNRQTIWKAAQKLTEKVGKKVVTERVIVKIKGRELEGYSFSVE